MFLDPYFSDDAGAIRISAAQGSAFAKDVAGDFNPIHDADNPRFCAPGDLLFALVLARHGVSQRMEFCFTGMVAADMPLSLVVEDGEIRALDAAGKVYLKVARDGALSRDTALIESLVRCYVAFSGQNFPHILVPLMQEREVMINPERPLVIYERMSFELERFDGADLSLKLTERRLDVAGRRGSAWLGFALESAGKAVGHGAKSLILSGLRDLDPDALQGLIDGYEAWRAAYLEGAASGAAAA